MTVQIKSEHNLNKIIMDYTWKWTINVLRMSDTQIVSEHVPTGRQKNLNKQKFWIDRPTPRKIEQNWDGLYPFIVVAAAAADDDDLMFFQTPYISAESCIQNVPILHRINL